MSASSHEALSSRLRERDEARRMGVEQRRREREVTQREEESAGHFTREFAAKKATIEELLSSANSLPKDELAPHFELLSTSYQSLQKFISDSAIFLTSYDLRSAQQQLALLLQCIDDTRERVLPKKKFAFKSRRKEVAVVQASNGGAAVVVKAILPPRVMKESFNSVVVKDKHNETLSLTAAEVEGQDVIISSLSGCEVRLLGPASTIHISKLEACTVLCGPVSSSVFVEECRNTTFVVACQQLRVHSTLNSTFHLHVSSRAIIEDSTHVSFAPYSLRYAGIEQHFTTAGLNREANNWRLVDDFNWLASRDPSPNWCVLPEEDRTSFTLS